MFIDWYLPGYRAGGPIQSCANMIDYLKHEFDFFVVTSDTDYHESKPYQNIISNQWTTLPNGTRVFYFSKKNLTKKNIYKILNEKNYDVVYLNGVFSKHFTLAPLHYFRKWKSKPVIIASRGMFAKGAMSLKQLKKKSFLFYARTIGLFSNVVFHASSEQEKKDILHHIGINVKVYVAANLPRKVRLEEQVEKTKIKNELNLICLSRISPEKNTKFAIEIVSKLKGTVALDIYGTVNNQAYWQGCQTLMRNLPKNVKVNYCGSLPGNEVLDTFKKYHFMFMPSLSENFGHSILESFITGTPVIISDQTMWKNLQEKKAGFDLSLSQKEKFISVIQRCVEMEGGEYRQWSAGALLMAKAFVENDSTLKQNIELFSNA